MAAAAGARLAAWGERLRRGFAAGRRAWLGPGPVAAAVAGVAVAGAGAAWYHGRVNVAAPQGSLTVLAQRSVNPREITGKPSPRKQRFMQFSSLEYGGEYYMTPRDFLFSVMFDHIQRKSSVKRLTDKDIEDTLAGIKKAGCGSTFFRDLGDKGLISYTEYLFLLTILTKPHSGFHVAFKMLDADGDEMVEKKEFFKEDSLPAEPQEKPKNTGVGSLSLFQGIFPTQKSNQGLLPCRWILHQLSYQESHNEDLRRCGKQSKKCLGIELGSMSVVNLKIKDKMKVFQLYSLK